MDQKNVFGKKYDNGVYEKYEDFFEELDKYKDKFLHILLKNEYYDYIPEGMIFSLQKKIMMFINEWAKYPIEDFRNFYENILDEDTKEYFMDEFELKEEVFDYVVKYESDYWFEAPF